MATIITLILSTFEHKECCVDGTMTLTWKRTVGEQSTFTHVSVRQISVCGEKCRLCRVPSVRFHYSTPKLPRCHQRLPFSNFHNGRSWFGLVHQVANYAQLCDIMEKSKPFLSRHCPFSWSPKLEEAFQLSKETIILPIRQGVETFDSQKHTCLHS